ncbi:hypothetical protein BT93_L4818 [Corymbia citriodora subsp. variegata]|uniref:Disease resistance RPP13-like protein 1 n=1 Tax=Corymbia citriodora subsp. variegata TaxID=360336 RepID=A0A8T0CTQ0_CORYI|nr:hypothetical protein BT93_L4818 [Corymbia citriodora subsp. variegata]
MPIVELFLGTFLEVLLDRLASHALLLFAQHKDIETLLEEWRKKLIGINQVLIDAEDRQLTDDHEVKLWLEDLKNLAYDIEDLLDELAIKSAENKSEAEPSTKKARLLLPKAFMSDHNMRSKMEEMDGRLKDIISRKDILRLTENNRQQSANLPFSTTHLTDEFFIGREDKKKEILELLTREEDGSTCTDIKVIPIVGMPGLGKTALAQQVFNNNRVTHYFDVKAWACVSVDFDPLSITKSILETTNPDLPSECKTLKWLQDELSKSLVGKKFLVVLDDVWDNNYGNWTFFLKPFRSGVKGSKIIVTTRDSKVASMIGARLITLELLSLDACMTLFQFHLLRVENFDHHHNLEVYGWKMVEKCGGLPLAMKALAGLLRTTNSPRDWEDILNNKIWEAPAYRSDILPALKLSYLHLPYHLRRCFAYCAIFPKDYEIQRDKLIHWWIAEGLMGGKEAKDQWNAGLNYFNELVNRSLFLKSSSDGSRFLMHDLVNDLAKLVAGTPYFDLGEFKGDHNNASLARHASFISNEYILLENFEIYYKMKKLRSFISLDKPSRNHNLAFVSQKVLCDLLSTLTYLRVLSFSHYQIIEVPESIGKLKLLRHLNLSYTNIKRLPESIVALYNLEALMLQGCEFLLELPKGIEKLINLRFLDISDTRRLEMMPSYIGKLVGLEMLSKFIVGMANGSRLKELKDLKNLGGELCISNLHMVEDATDAHDANLCTKKGICRLTMQWSTDFENSRNEGLEEEVLSFLYPHQNLADLEISYYGGLKFPSWLGSPTYVNIVCLRLQGCRRVKALPSLGQLSSLKELYIRDLNAICMVGSEFYGSNSPFPSLITLEFNGMPLWEDWSHCVDSEEIEVLFPRLEHLMIQDCPKLIGRLPSRLSSVIKLEINSCSCMDASSFIISLPSLDELNFRGCNKGVLKSLVNLTSCCRITCLNHGFTSSLTKLEKLEMKRCKNLMYLWQDKDVILNLASLKSLVVESCPEFISFIAGEGDLELPNNLETIKLEHCDNLEKLPSKMHTLSSLKDLTVHRCSSLVCFLETGMPTSMTSLDIANCKMLLSLPRGLIVHRDEHNGSGNNNVMSYLQELKISECNSLPASLFSEGRILPATLKKLEIMWCTGVESLAEKFMDGLESLQEFQISFCENLRSLPHSLHTLSHLTFLWWTNCPALELECFPPLPPSISSIYLEECPKIKSLPNQMYRLTYLRELTIERCESITCFPDGGLPPQLQILRVRGCENMKQPVREWLTPLTSLEVLDIDGSVGGVGEKLDLVLPLPSSLLNLLIYDMEKVERLSSNSLPPSLRILCIEDCPTLRELPQDGLPPSLEWLWIKGCWMVEERCKKGTGCYWPLIRQIPYVFLSAGDSIT